MKLASHIIVREERDAILLFNGVNAGLVSIQKSEYANLKYSEHVLSSEMLDLKNWLQEFGFLVPKESSLNAHHMRHSPKGDQMETFDGFFDLRSDLSPLNVLWAITPNCNLHCIYCFPNASTHAKTFRPLPVESLHHIAEQLVLSKVLKVTISGGECFLAPGLWSVVRILKNSGVRVTLLSNGTTIQKSILEKIKNYQVNLGISLDAPNEQTNSITRGPGVFQKTIRAIDQIIKSGISIAILVTLTRHNFHLLDDHLSFLENLGVRCVSIQDLRPFGTRDVYDQHRLTIDQEKKLHDWFVFLKSKHPNLLIYPTELFIFSKDKASGYVMQCPAGDNFAYIDFFCDLYPCTSLPSFRMGNLLGAFSLNDLWQRSEAITRLRHIKGLPLSSLPGCCACPNKSYCEGGCRGDAQFYSGDLFGLPSRCPKRFGIC